jgi:hypothetical protein
LSFMFIFMFPKSWTAITINFVKLILLNFGKTNTFRGAALVGEYVWIVFSSVYARHLRRNVATGWPDWANFRNLGDCFFWGGGK